MAEVSNFQPDPPPEDEFYLDSPDDYTASFNFTFDLTENLGLNEYEEPNCFFYGGEDDDDDDEQMNFVTDLFESREAHVIESPNLEFDSDSPFEFGFGPGLGGLRVAGVDSESDSEEFEVNSGFVDNDVDEFDSFVVSNSDNLRMSESEIEREEFEWEEVSERVHFDETENLISVIDRIEEISVSSETSSSEVLDSRSDEEWEEEEEEEEEEQDVVWEVLLAVNNLERSLGFENLEENDHNGGDVPPINLPEDYILPTEYDTLFEQLLENEYALKGSPPAAKSVVESLPLVVLSKKEVEENNSAVVCAVCKDEVAEGEKVTRMPCCHLYHGDCILPWLKIRNTCPVCRYELPTDDANYEKRRSGRGGSAVAALLAQDLEFRSNFEMLL